MEVMRGVFGLFLTRFQLIFSEGGMRAKATSPVSLGHILRAARKQKGLSQAEAGKSVGIDQATMSKIERGESNARIDTLFRLLAALDMDLLVMPREKMSEKDAGDTW